MDKLKLLARELDGVTVVAQAPTFQLVNGWSQATLTTPAGILPAGLWGKVPGGDPYLPNPDVVSLPPRGLVPLDATLTFTKRGVGTPVLTPFGDDTLSGGLPAFGVTRTVFVRNNGDEWAFVGA